MLVGIPANESELEARVISMGTCRVLRIKQVGKVFFVENMQQRREVDTAGKETLQEEWKIVAVSKDPERGYFEAHEFLAEANQKVLAMMAQDMRRARPV